MTRADERPDQRQDLRVMPWWLVVLGLIAAVLAGTTVTMWLLDVADAGDSAAALRIDAIRTGLTVVAGTGGAVALVLAARRQWLSERAQRHRESMDANERRHRERVQAHAETTTRASQELQAREARVTEHDATERRLTDLYTKAVDLLGNAHAAARMAGMYALERLAQDHAAQRQTIADVFCAYLRMPGRDGEEAEFQVRQTAQRVLARHLQPAARGTFWPGIRLDLAGAHLTDFELASCDIVEGDFRRAVFQGRTSLAGTRVRSRLNLAYAVCGVLVLDDLQCDGETLLDEAAFSGPASLDRARFTDRFSLREATCHDAVSFAGATFGRTAEFDLTTFAGVTSFRDATFEQGCSIERAVFRGDAHFHRATFRDMILVRWTVFHGGASFRDAVFGGALTLARVTFHGTAEFNGARLSRRPRFDQTRATSRVPHGLPDDWRTERVDDDWLAIGPTGGR